ncbi:hypothetical protein [Mucilaginibacter paludis]|uniref:Uncharacterized protein n=1 Tax=Mucilaginibacter paludis DSM 18603 TaxID=714943 RepID=H1Y1W7_9SPHI|nr:hypothetical protein [Mucilaginibacter paludis]EHQ25670.1 hypothetical protein Mucpa_1512 [Mucilaginibacter paludis DSM 18603]
MKTKLLLLCLMLPAAAFCQSITSPMVASSDDHTTTITKVEVTGQNTVVSFKHICYKKGSWVQLNKSMYLQDANGEERYNYVRSEGMPLRPAKFTATADNQEVDFKVYFEKLKPGTKEINVIERARSLAELSDGITYFNYYKVNLYKSKPETAIEERVVVRDVTLMPPPRVDDAVTVDTAYSVGTNFSSGIFKGDMTNLGPIMSGMYTSLLNAQLKIYSDPAITDQLARITKNYYDALIKAGFSMDAALKIITSKQLVSMDGIAK